MHVRVVPAKAGTHKPPSSIVETRRRTPVLNYIRRGVWVPDRASLVRDDIDMCSRFSRRIAPEVCSSPKNRGRREDRCSLHPRTRETYPASLDSHPYIHKSGYMES